MKIIKGYSKNVSHPKRGRQRDSGNFIASIRLHDDNFLEQCNSVLENVMTISFCMVRFRLRF